MFSRTHSLTSNLATHMNWNKMRYDFSSNLYVVCTTRVVLLSQRQPFMFSLDICTCISIICWKGQTFSRTESKPLNWISDWWNQITHTYFFCETDRRRGQSELLSRQEKRLARRELDYLFADLFSKTDSQDANIKILPKRWITMHYLQGAKLKLHLINLE
jgi:hypothetical protein